MPIPSSGYMAYDATTLLISAWAKVFDYIMIFIFKLFILMIYFKTQRSNPSETFPSSTYVSNLKTTNFQGLSGPIEFDSNGDRLGYVA